MGIPPEADAIKMQKPIAQAGYILILLVNREYVIKELYTVVAIAGFG